MRTKQYIQVEAIVAKYKALASETEAAKKTSQSVNDSYFPEDYGRIEFVQQLIAHIYQLRAGDSANPDVIKEYKGYTNFFIQGVLDKDEEQFLIDNFDTFVDYAFDQSNVVFVSGRTENYYPPREWSCLVPHLLNNHSGKVFIAHSDDGREFVGMNQCDLMVVEGFENAAIRALACGQNIEAYKHPDSTGQLWSDIEECQFDTVIVGRGWPSDNSLSLEERFNACIRIAKEGGEILLCLSKEDILSDQTASLRNRLKSERILQEAIQLPSGDLLLHIVKKTHDSFVMCDASQLSNNSNERVVVDVEAFQREIKKRDMPECDNSPIVRRYCYEELNESILLPAYYLRLPKGGTPIRDYTCNETELFLSDECGVEEKVVTINHLSKVLTKGEFQIADLTVLKREYLRRYYRVEGPAVIMATSEQDIAIGYTTDRGTFLVPRNLYVLKPKEGVDVRYLAGKLLTETFKGQLCALVYGKGINAKLTSNWCDLVRLDLPSLEEQQQFVQETILKEYAMQESYVAKQEKSFKHAIHLRKHALSQNLSAFDSLFRSLEYCMSEQKGHLKETDQLSPVSPMTVGDAMTILHSELETICDRVAHFTDDSDWGSCEAIEPQQLIELYEEQNRNTVFRFDHSWEPHEPNCFSKDVYDKETGKLLFHKGESMNTAWFPRKALLQVVDNIVSNAREHGFKDESRNDYVLKTSWDTDGLNMIIKISNNGAPLPTDVNADLILEYGYTTALNQRGHGGIGGGEIAEIMHRYGGSVSVISTPNKWFVITYVLTLPLASVY